MTAFEIEQRLTKIGFGNAVVVNGRATTTISTPRPTRLRVDPLGGWQRHQFWRPRPEQRWTRTGGNLDADIEMNGNITRPTAPASVKIRRARSAPASPGLIRNSGELCTYAETSSRRPVRAGSLVARGVISNTALPQAESVGSWTRSRPSPRAAAGHTLGLRHNFKARWRCRPGTVCATRRSRRRSGRVGVGRWTTTRSTSPRARTGGRAGVFDGHGRASYDIPGPSSNGWQGNVARRPREAGAGEDRRRARRSRPATPTPPTKTLSASCPIVRGHAPIEVNCGDLSERTLGCFYDKRFAVIRGCWDRDAGEEPPAGTRHRTSCAATSIACGFRRWGRSSELRRRSMLCGVTVL